LAQYSLKAALRANRDVVSALRALREVQFRPPAPPVFGVVPRDDF
jgi:hypothetical protein